MCCPIEREKGFAPAKSHEARTRAPGGGNSGREAKSKPWEIPFGRNLHHAIATYT